MRSLATPTCIAMGIALFASSGISQQPSQPIAPRSVAAALAKEWPNNRRPSMTANSRARAVRQSIVGSDLVVIAEFIKANTSAYATDGLASTLTLKVVETLKGDPTIATVAVREHSGYIGHGKVQAMFDGGDIISHNLSSPPVGTRYILRLSHLPLDSTAGKTPRPPSPLPPLPRSAAYYTHYDIPLSIVGDTLFLSRDAGMIILDVVPITLTEVRAAVKDVRAHSSSKTPPTARINR